MKDTTEKLKNIQLYPADSFKIANDALTKKLFEMCIDAKENAEVEIVDSRAKDVKTSIKISNYSDLKFSLNEFDWAVFDAAISERIADNGYTTAAIIARKLGASHTPTKALQDAIIASLEKFAAIRIVADFDAIKKMYESPIGHFKFRGYLLPTESLEMSVNGQDAALIHFISKGVVLATAEMKDQIITCDAVLLSPPVNMTPRAIAINHFLLRRIKEMKGTADAAKHNKRVKPLRHTILLESLYRACGLDNAKNFQKQDARATIETILNYYVEKDFIKGYEFETGRNRKVRAINFIL